MGLKKIDNYLWQVLPFYDTKDKQFFRRRNVQNNSTFPDQIIRICDKHRFLPFQIERLKNVSILSNIQFKLYDIDDNYILDYRPQMVAGEVDIATIGDFDRITYFGNQDLISGYPACGIYYLVFDDTIADKQYSEIFKITEFPGGEYHFNQAIMNYNNFITPF